MRATLQAVSDRDNVEILRRGFEGFRERGIDAMEDLVHPDFEGGADPQLLTEPQVYRGPEGIRRWFEGFEGFIEDVRFEADQFVGNGDRVLVAARLVGRGVGSGIEVEQRAWQVWTLRDGRAIRLHIYADEAEARREAGLDPEPGAGE
jgi:ketosteroid isomerase-like protein